MYTHSHYHWPHFALVASQTQRGKSVSRSECIRCDKAVREQLTESDIDKMLKDSFPASDPPSVY